MARAYQIRFSVLALLFAASLGARPAFAQVDLSGTWAPMLHEDGPDRGPGPEIGDYTGLPINDAARMRADSWDAEKWTMAERVCEPYPPEHSSRGRSSALRVWPQVDTLTQTVTAWHMTFLWLLSQRTVYMDGRPHPPDYAAHRWQGFSTGEWEADMLKVTTTHLKEGFIRRNGLARSEKGTLTEYYIRHGDSLTQVSIVEDPVYLTEPLVRSVSWVLDQGLNLIPSYCIASSEIDHPRGWVPYHLPGQNRWLDEFAQRYGVPLPAARGGAETMYPEYQEKLAKMAIPPKSGASFPDNK